MTITIKEIQRSRSRSLQERTLEYMAWGSDDSDEIEDAIAAFAPSEYGGLFITGYTQRPRDNNAGVFDAVVTYGPAPTDDAPEFSFELAMTTSHITVPLERISTYGTVDNLPGIGFDADKGYEGTDIQVPVFTWRETIVRSDALINNAYFGQLMQCAANPVNIVGYRGFAPGEVLYMGASGSKKVIGKMSISHSFGASPNRTGLSVGMIGGITKSGWDYMWATYEKNTDPDSHAIVETPRGVYVDRVYGRSNFSSLLEI
jgi:hypothetical protein